jgi:hypothetical protein
VVTVPLVVGGSGGGSFFDVGDGDGHRGGQAGVGADLFGDLVLDLFGDVAAVVPPPGDQGEADLGATVLNGRGHAIGGHPIVIVAGGEQPGG